MQKYILLWLLLLRHMVGYSQYINYESVELIRGACSTCVTGFKLNLKECKKVKKLSLSLDSISGVRYKDSIVVEGLGYFTHLEELEVRDRAGVVKFAKLPPHLKKLNCWNIRLSALPPLPKSLRELDCGGAELTALPPLPKSLRELDCYDNELTALPSLPKSLRVLLCGDNKLTSLPPLPASLEVLNCRNNNNLKGIASKASQPSNLLKSSEVRLPSIQRLYADTLMYYYLKHTLPDNIYLNINGANMGVQLPSRLCSLYLSDYEEDKLPLLPPTLQTLNIRGKNGQYSRRFQVDSLPLRLETLVLDGYYHTILPPLPSTLCALVVTTDSVLPPLPEGLIELNSNQPPQKLPKSLEYLIITRNPHTIPPLHEGLKYLNINTCSYASAPRNIVLPPLPSTIQNLYLSCVLPDRIQIPATAKLREVSCTHCTEAHLKQIPTEHLKKIYVKLPCLPPAFEHIDRAGTPICK